MYNKGCQRDGDCCRASAPPLPLPRPPSQQDSDLRAFLFSTHSWIPLEIVHGFWGGILKDGKS